MKQYRIASLLSFLLIITFILTSCVQEPGQTEMPVVTQTEIDQPTAIPILETESVQKRVILLAQENNNSSQFTLVQGLLSDLALEEKLIFETTDTLTIEPWDNSIQIVVAFETDTDLVSLASAKPSVQFLALNISNTVPSANLSSINISLKSLQDQAFLAGYLAAIATEDYRVGVLVSANDEVGQVIAQSFYIGAQYFCGLCNSRFGPIEYYPKMALISDPSQQQSWQSAVDLLIEKSVKTVFIQSEVISEELVNYLTTNGIRIIVPISQSNFQQNQNWMATLQLGPLTAIENVLPQLLLGQGGFEETYMLDLIESNPGLISEGRSEFFMKVYADVISGFINTVGSN